MTADHAVYLDGKLAAARQATRGSLLRRARGEEVSVTQVTHAAVAAVVNPLTLAGTLLASDAGEPLLVASAPEWFATLVVGSRVFPALTLTSLLSYCWPATTQAAFDSFLEPTLLALAPGLSAATAALPTGVLVALFVVVDVGFVLGVAGWGLAGPAKLATLATALVAVRLSSRASRLRA